jgi:translation initiation factor 1
MSSRKGGFSTLADRLRAEGFEALEVAPGAEEVASPPEDVGLDFTGKFTIRKERKGRAGKTVTIVGGLSGSQQAIEELVRDWKKRLGRGARLDADRIVIQGDCGEQLRDLLLQCGAKRVSLSD